MRPPSSAEVQHGPAKSWYPTTSLHGVTTQKTTTLVFIAVGNLVSRT